MAEASVSPPFSVGRSVVTTEVRGACLRNNSSFTSFSVRFTGEEVEGSLVVGSFFRPLQTTSLQDWPFALAAASVVLAATSAAAAFSSVLFGLLHLLPLFLLLRRWLLLWLLLWLQLLRLRLLRLRLLMFRLLNLGLRLL